MDRDEIFAKILSNEIDMDIMKTMMVDLGVTSEEIDDKVTLFSEKLENELQRLMNGMTNEKIHKDEDF